MSKLSGSQGVPRNYNPASIQTIVRLIEQQVNQLAEGAIVARHGAMTAAPTAGTWIKGDLVDNSSPAVVTDDVADYVIVGWICTASGSPGTWKERRVLVEGISMVRDPTLGTEVAATSGTSIDFTSIPSWVKKITIQVVGLSTSGTSVPILQLGDAGDVEATGYLGTAVLFTNSSSAQTSAFTTGFGIGAAWAATSVAHGTFTLTLEDSTAFTWVCTGVFGWTDSAQNSFTGGSKSLSAALDRVRLTTAGGTDTFDAGAVNVLFE